MPTFSSAAIARSLRSADFMPRYVRGSSTFSYTFRSPIRLKLWKMNPISRLRTRARSLAGRSATAWPFSQYSPLEAESSRPSIDSSVDLPQPDGPAIDTYSPFATSRLTSESACVSTSSVRKTLATDFNLITLFPLVDVMLASRAVVIEVERDRTHPRRTYPTRQPDRPRSGRKAIPLFLPTSDRSWLACVRRSRQGR